MPLEFGKNISDLSFVPTFYRERLCRSMANMHTAGCKISGPKTRSVYANEETNYGYQNHGAELL
jgi:hypothetical protein